MTRPAKGATKNYVMTHMGSKLTITTDQMRKDSLEALLGLLYKHWHQSNPDSLDDFMERLNKHHGFAKAKLKPDDPSPELEEQGFDFFEAMMQRVRER
ncbi:hypothetical protein BBD42_27010 [Paenibacillus sp. BIHB 4019]|uniref:Uncharacterized protein n=1 Tax=Paenibacillus sp. BIHB 4019 TaxID=1870819 RepID=A0A1B2DPU0_9BACL|nr:hypothetical protein [Paenibacillus sp. BIHB 4019]ANY69734.1 hypothetical protein BBD42_27010 [Paenibacillus sp. BIHB 4019]